jgi:hypothetical protein
VVDRLVAVVARSQKKQEERPGNWVASVASVAVGILVAAAGASPPLVDTVAHSGSQGFRGLVLVVVASPISPMFIFTINR